jgi:hypothetical protein
MSHYAVERFEREDNYRVTFNGIVIAGPRLTRELAIDIADQRNNGTPVIYLSTEHLNIEGWRA